MKKLSFNYKLNNELLTYNILRNIINLFIKSNKIELKNKENIISIKLKVVNTNKKTYIRVTPIFYIDHKNYRKLFDLFISA